VRAVLVDAGPLVALLDRSDPDHQACRSALTAIRDPLATVWPAVTEAMYLLGRVSWPAQDALWELLEEVRILPLETRDARRMRALMEKYRSLPMDLADAALVAVAEREMIRSIFTLDGRDFGVYRPARIGRFSVIP
jgi:predicted nucleic acid-binding protein